MVLNSTLYLCSEIRECLKLDADHKECFAHYKKVKKLVALLKSVEDLVNSEQWEGCIEKAQSILSLEKNIPPYEFSAKVSLCQCQGKVSGQYVCVFYYCIR